MDRFDISVGWVFDAEGFYSNDPTDRGGATKFGISLRFLKQLPRNEGDLNRDGIVDAADVRFVTVDKAREIYLSEFWEPCRCSALPRPLDCVMFCAAVNHGEHVAKLLLQSALGVKADGFIGRVTLAAAQAAQPAEIVPEYLARRAMFYADIVAADATQAKFERGWYRRLFRLQHAASSGRL